MRAGSPIASRQCQRGVTYLWVLFLVFLLGLGMGKSLEVYSYMLKREKAADARYELKLQEAAMQAYFDNSPGYLGTYPTVMDHLLLDPRHLTIQRYLRRPLLQEDVYVRMPPQSRPKIPSQQNATQ